jgi:hypothetical protein
MLHVACSLAPWDAQLYLRGVAVQRPSWTLAKQSANCCGGASEPAGNKAFMELNAANHHGILIAAVAAAWRLALCQMVTSIAGAQA